MDSSMPSPSAAKYCSLPLPGLEFKEKSGLRPGEESESVDGVGANSGFKLQLKRIVDSDKTENIRKHPIKIINPSIIHLCSKQPCVVWTIWPSSRVIHKRDENG